MSRLKQLYRKLLKYYGSQGWWPVAGKYHRGNYSFPRNSAERFEICIGAILTQAVAWKSVEKALENLRKSCRLGPSQLLRLSDAELQKAIKPSGYFRQKSKKLREFANFYISLKGRTPSRDELLAVWGIGPETADSILLYAYKVPTFVVDAYTKRILNSLGIVDEKAPYDKIKSLFEKALKRDLKVYQECHALLVEHAKRHKRDLKDSF
jgi:endonuclease III related protein